MIQGFMLDPPQREKVEWSGTELVKMECLRILIVRNTSFSSELEQLPNYLRLLDWEECPSESFPPKFNPKHIIVLNLPRTRPTLEEPFKLITRYVPCKGCRKSRIEAERILIFDLRVLLSDKEWLGHDRLLEEE
ncbi:hypothetical protein ACSQ67_016972 [Phaseolus vulgaris]